MVVAWEDSGIVGIFVGVFVSSITYSMWVPAANVAHTRMHTVFTTKTLKNPLPPLCSDGETCEKPDFILSISLSVD